MTTLVLSDNTTPQNATADDHQTGLIDDAEIYVFATGTNYGAQTSIQATRFSGSPSVNTVIKGDFLTHIPASQQIDSATLYLDLGNRTSGVNLDIDFYRLLVAFDEAQVTWNDRVTSTAWGTAGALGNGTDRDGTLTGTMALGTDPGTSTFYSVDVTADVADMYAGTVTNHGWMFQLQSGDNSAEFQSSESTVDGRRPELVIVYSAAAGDATAPTYSVTPAENSVTSSSITVDATASDETDADVDHYAVAVADGATAPSATQVSNGQDSTGSAAISSGSDLGVTNAAEGSITLTGLSDSTAYDVYYVIGDSSGNLSTVTLINSTTADGTAPVFTVAPAADTLQGTSIVVDATATDNLSATVDHYAVVVADAATAPSAAQVKAGQDSAGAAATASGNDLNVTSGSEASISLSGLTKNTAYDVYWVAEDDDANITAVQGPVNVTTADPALQLDVAGADSLLKDTDTGTNRNDTGVEVIVVGGTAGARTLVHEDSLNITSGVLADIVDVSIDGDVGGSYEVILIVSGTVRGVYPATVNDRNA